MDLNEIISGLVNQPTGVQPGVERQPSSSEVAFFMNQGRNIPGMMTEDSRITMNPFSELQEQERNSVKINEAVRVALKDDEPPNFPLTIEQLFSFSSINNGAPYGSMDDIRKTIIARIIANDPSALNVTPEQVNFADNLAGKLKKSNKLLDFE